MSIKEIFENMDYGPAPESAGDALAWIVDQGSRFGHFINGAFTEAGEGFDSRNPATGEVLATLTQATQDDVDAAVAAARAAQPAWEALGGPGRARHLYALARLLQKHARLFAVLETLDNGKPIRESRDIDIPLAQRHFYYHAGMAQLMDSELPDRQALGVCGQIVPWNFPLLMLSWKIAPALAAGCTVVHKPAEFSPMTAKLLVEIAEEAGLPKGVLNVVNGFGEDAGKRLTEHPDIKAIAFVGESRTGSMIMAQGAATLKRVHFELGGKNPVIIFDDADIDRAVDAAVFMIYSLNGERCTSSSRLLVQDTIYDEVTRRVAEAAGRIKVGHPLDPDTVVGPVIHPEHEKAD